MRLETAPSPTAIPPPPTAHKSTLINVESSGVIIGTIVKNNIPTPNDPKSESHNLCFPTTLIVTKMDVKISESKIFERIQHTIPPTPAVPTAKDKPEIFPPSNAPTKKAISILAAVTNAIQIFEIT